MNCVLGILFTFGVIAYSDAYEIPSTYSTTKSQTVTPSYLPIIYPSTQTPTYKHLKPQSVNLKPFEKTSPQPVYKHVKLLTTTAKPTYLQQSEPQKEPTVFEPIDTATEHTGPYRIIPFSQKPRDSKTFEVDYKTSEVTSAIKPQLVSRDKKLKPTEESDSKYENYRKETKYSGNTAKPTYLSDQIYTDVKPTYKQPEPEHDYRRYKPNYYKPKPSLPIYLEKLGYGNQRTPSESTYNPLSESTYNPLSEIYGDERLVSRSNYEDYEEEKHFREKPYIKDLKKYDKKPYFDEYYKKPAHYTFGYGVSDDYGPSFGHSEKRSGYRTEGSYFVDLPDGRRMTVSYYSDETGYHPTVTYQGSAVHPENTFKFPEKYEKYPSVPEKYRTVPGKYLDDEIPKKYPHLKENYAEITVKYQKENYNYPDLVKNPYLTPKYPVFPSYLSVYAQDPDYKSENNDKVSKLDSKSSYKKRPTIRLDKHV